VQPERLAYLREARAELQRRLHVLNAEFARELRQLRGSITMAHEVLADDDGLAEELVRALVKEMVERHPGGQPAARLLARIEDTERRLLAVEGELGPQA
jgi:phosphoenolpyruvate-protein kinase (PTS system EI component)